MCYVLTLDEARCPSPVHWALPVDIAKLISSLEAYQALRTLHLCRTYQPQSSLARLPQEVVDRIVSNMLEVHANETYHAWAQAFACYQFRCKSSDHSAFRKNYAQDPLWRLFLREMSNEDGPTDQGVCGTHQDLKDAWKYQTCACNPEHGFCGLKKLLETHFGLTTIVQHVEVQSDMHVTLCQSENHSEILLDTLCFLVPTSGALTHSPCGQSLATDTAETPKLDIPQSLYSRFAKARRILQINPRCSIVDIEQFVKLRMDALFNSMCPRFDANNKRRKAMLVSEQVVEQNKFLHVRHRELAEQRWPQPISWNQPFQDSPISDRNPGFDETALSW